MFNPDNHLVQSICVQISKEHVDTIVFAPHKHAGLFDNVVIVNDDDTLIDESIKQRFGGRSKQTLMFYDLPATKYISFLLRNNHHAQTNVIVVSHNILHDPTIQSNHDFYIFHKHDMVLLREQIDDIQGIAIPECAPNDDNNLLVFVSDLCVFKWLTVGGCGQVGSTSVGHTFCPLQIACVTEMILRPDLAYLRSLCSQELHSLLFDVQRQWGSEDIPPFYRRIFQ